MYGKKQQTDFRQTSRLSFIHINIKHIHTYVLHSVDPTFSDSDTQGVKGGHI